MIQVNKCKFKFQNEFWQSSYLWLVLLKLLQIALIFLFYFSESGSGKKGAKKKGSSFQTVSALFRVQYILECQKTTSVTKLNYCNFKKTLTKLKKAMLYKGKGYMC